MAIKFKKKKKRKKKLQEILLLKRPCLENKRLTNLSKM